MEAGFFDRDRMRHAFLRILGQPPQAIRRVGKESRVPPEMPDDSGTDAPSPARDANFTHRFRPMTGGANRGTRLNRERPRVTGSGYSRTCSLPQT